MVLAERWAMEVRAQPILAITSGPVVVVVAVTTAEVEVAVIASLQGPSVVAEVAEDRVFPLPDLAVLLETLLETVPLRLLRSEESAWSLNRPIHNIVKAIRCC